MDGYDAHPLAGAFALNPIDHDAAPMTCQISVAGSVSYGIVFKCEHFKMSKTRTSGVFRIINGYF